MIPYHRDYCTNERGVSSLLAVIRSISVIRPKLIERQAFRRIALSLASSASRRNKTGFSFLVERTQAQHNATQIPARPQMEDVSNKPRKLGVVAVRSGTTCTPYSIIFLSPFAGEFRSQKSGSPVTKQSTDWAFLARDGDRLAPRHVILPLRP